MAPKAKVINFYMDDSGTRHPDRKPGRAPAHGCDYFALGGVLVDETAEDMVRQAHGEFCSKWKITHPLHSSEIRARQHRFAWIGKLEEEVRDQFYDELFHLLLKIDCVGLACVVDRPGYNARYKERYRDDRWLLCKTAFCIAVERAAKYARKRSSKLRVLPERCNKKDDDRLRLYYNDLQANGSPFDSENEKRYSPLHASDYAETFRELRFKYKTSPLAQLADLFLWPMAMGGYDAGNRPYAGFCKNGKLIDQQCADPTAEGIKYSCFELVGERT